MKVSILIFLAVVTFSCNQKLTSGSQMPYCLQEKINEMSSEPGGAPISVTQYNFKGQTVYYMRAPCCDHFNIVYDKECNILGRPDGGITGRGDGTLRDFRDSATNEKIVWEAEKK